MRFLVLFLMSAFSFSVFAQDSTTPTTTTTTTTTTTAEPSIVSETVPNTATVVAGYDKGFFVQSADEKFKLVIGGYIQGLFEGRLVEAGSDTDTFRVRRARPKLSGHIFSKKIQYVFEYDISSNKLLEGSIQFACSDELKYKIGQYYVPFSLENVTSSSNLQFVDRSIIQGYFGLPDERETGTGINGAILDHALEYDIGIFNGEGLNTLNLNNEMRYAARLVFSVMGKHKNESSDIGISEKPQISIAAGGMFNDTMDPATIPAGGTLANATSEKKIYSVTPELNAKYRGLGFHTAYFYQKSNPDVGASVTDHGFLAQLGFLVTPKIEVAGRWATIMKDVGNDQAEYTGGINYYLHEDHRAKFQVDFSALTEDNAIAAGNNRMDYRARAQFQIKL